MAQLSRDIDEMLDVFADLSIGDLCLRDVFTAITDAMSRHRLKLPADILLLIKALSTIESVGRELDPSFKIVDHATPLVESLIAEKHSPSTLAGRAADAGRELAVALRTLAPNLADIVRRPAPKVSPCCSCTAICTTSSAGWTDGATESALHRHRGAIVIGSSIVVHAGLGPQLLDIPCSLSQAS